jgi:protein-L-isoaspartate(D-aspartate) O-methyltransferase
MSFESQRTWLVQELKARGVRDERVLHAVGQTPRELFVLPELRHAAYDDRALPIAASQTISQPLMVALMTQELRLHGDEKVLEIGTGSGYQAAILSRLCRQVVTIERIAELSRQAEQVLRGLGIGNVEFHVGDGTLGWPPREPYHGIIVTAGAPEVPPELYRQLAPGGRLVIPVGTESPLMLQTIVREESCPRKTDVCPCSFVPLIGEQGWAE